MKLDPDTSPKSMSCKWEVVGRNSYKPVLFADLPKEYQPQTGILLQMLDIQIKGAFSYFSRVSRTPVAGQSGGRLLRHFNHAAANDCIFHPEN